MLILFRGFGVSIQHFYCIMYILLYDSSVIRCVKLYMCTPKHSSGAIISSRRKQGLRFLGLKPQLLNEAIVEVTITLKNINSVSDRT